MGVTPPFGGIRRGISMWSERLRHYWDVARAALETEKSRGKPVPRERDEIEFLPAALEILETPASPVGRSLMWALIALFVIALVWSIIGRLDVVAMAQGKVIPSGRSKVVQPLEAGIVKAILVHNGQHVSEGQSLIELDPTQTGADVDKTRMARIDATLAAARAQALLDAQKSGREPKIRLVEGATPDRQRDTQRLAEGLFSEYRSKLTSLRAELQKREQELETTKHNIDSLLQRVPIARGVAEDYRTLQAKNYVAKHAFLEKEQTRIQLEKDLAGQQSYARELEASILESRHNIETAIAQFRREQLDVLNQAEQQLAQSRSDETKAAQRQNQTRLTASVAGTVQQLAIHTVGGVVTPAQELLVLVPDEAGLEIEAQVLNRDIGFVRPGQEAEIKLDAFPYTHYGTIPGKLISISQDAAKDDKLGLIYPARIQLLKTAIAADSKEVPLAPGMAATVEIKTEQRRIIEYLLTPVLKYRHEALRER